MYPKTVHLASYPVSFSSCFVTISPAPPSFVLSTPAPLSLTFSTEISPPFGVAPSATTTILKRFPTFALSFIFSTVLFIFSAWTIFKLLTRRRFIERLGGCLLA